MAEPRGDYFQRDARLQEVHRRRVAKGMGRDSPPAQRWATLGGHRDGPCETICCAVAREWIPAAIGENELIAADLIRLQPPAQALRGRWPEWRSALFASLPEQPDGLGLHVGRAELQNLGNPRSRAGDRSGCEFIQFER